MKKRYIVYLSRLEYGSVIVRAETEEEAIDKARKAEKKGQVFWHHSELTDVAPTEDTLDTLPVENKIYD